MSRKDSLEDLKLAFDNFDEPQNNTTAQLFEQIDTDGSGTIEDHELLTHLLEQGKDDETIRALFRALDANKDGKITRDEWNAGFELYTRSMADAGERHERANAYADPYAIWRAMRAGEAILVRASWLLKRAGYEEGEVEVDGASRGKVKVPDWVLRREARPLPHRAQIEKDYYPEAIMPVVRGGVHQDARGGGQGGE